MGIKTGIEWADATYNPWQGCHKVSVGCANCYMYREKIRFGQEPGIVVRSKPPTFNLPLRLPTKSKVFVCSWSDFFIEEADPWRAEAWEIIRKRSDLTFMILTKRSKRMHDLIKEPLPNVWLGVTAENQQMADIRIPVLLQTPAAKRFVSIEPMLGPVDLSGYTGRAAMKCCACGLKYDHDSIIGGTGCRGLDWAIVGAETGPNKRIMNNKWALDLRDQCMGVIPFFFKKDSDGSNLLDGKEYHEFPRS